MRNGRCEDRRDVVSILSFTAFHSFRPSIMIKTGLEIDPGPRSSRRQRSQGQGVHLRERESHDPLLSADKIKEESISRS